MDRSFALVGAVLAFVGVAIGAFGAHGLQAHFEAHPDLGRIFETGARYHMYHALALLAVAWLASRQPGALVRWAGILFVVGIVLFSGSLYALAVTGLRKLGMITPLGGLAFLAGWGCLAACVWRRPDRQPG